MAVALMERGLPADAAGRLYGGNSLRRQSRKRRVGRRKHQCEHHARHGSGRAATFREVRSHCEHDRSGSRGRPRRKYDSMQIKVDRRMRNGFMK